MSQLAEHTINAFHDSFERCRANPEFFDVFYERLLVSSDKVAELFADADLERLKPMTREALYYFMMASDSRQVSSEKLEELGKKHSSYGLSGEDYDIWLEALMSVVEEIDPQYSQSVDQAWRLVMQRGMSIMRASVS